MKIWIGMGYNSLTKTATTAFSETGNGKNVFRAEVSAVKKKLVAAAEVQETSFTLKVKR